MGARFALAILAMAVVVTASNILVQFPVQARFGGLDFAEILTWGAFTYPVAFMVNDLTNRHFGPAAARKVVLVGFAIAVLISIWLASPRIAVASGAAFLTAQLLDTQIFHALRSARWWKGPLASSIVGSFADTLLFFSIAFSATFAFLDTGLGYADSSLAFPVPFLSVLGFETPLWVSLAAGDLLIKLMMGFVLLVPYKGLRRLIPDRVLGSA